MAQQVDYHSINRFHGLQTSQSNRTADPGLSIQCEDVDFEKLDALQGRRASVSRWANGAITGLACYGDLVINSTATELFDRDTCIADTSVIGTTTSDGTTTTIIASGLSNYIDDYFIGYEATINVYGSDLITNGDMELDSNWANFVTPAINERSSEQKHGGTYSRKFVTDGVTSGGIKSDTFTTVTGKEYKVVLWVYLVDYTTVHVAIRQGDNLDDIHNQQHYGLTANAWNQIIFDYEEVGGGSSAYIAIYGPSSAAITFYIDDVSVRSVEEDTETVTDFVSSTGTLTVDTMAGVSLLGDTVTLAGTGWGGWFSHFKLDDWIYCANGIAFIRTDGSDYFKVGITAPSSVPTVAAGDPGVLNGDYYYKVTFVDSDGFESNASSASLIVQPVDDQVNVSAIDTGDGYDDVVARKLYRTQAGGSVYYLVTTISDNTTVVYVDNIADGSLTLTTPPTNHNKPEVDFTLIATCQDRWFGAKGTRRLYYSLPYPNERAQPSTYYIDFPDPIVGLKSLGQVLLVLCEDGPYILSGLSDPDTFYYRGIKDKVFVKSIRASNEFKKGVVTQGTEGIFYITDVQAELISNQIRNLLASPSNTAQIGSGSDIFYILLLESTANVDIGETVRLAVDDSYATFAHDASLDIDYGIVIDITDDDSYEFSAETGIIVAIGGQSDNPAQILVGDWRNGTLEWGYYQEESTAIDYDIQTKTVYLGDDTGVSSLTGDRGEFVWKSGHNYLGHPGRQKELLDIYIGHVDCSSIQVEVFTDGGSTAVLDQTISDQDGKLHITPEDVWGVTFSLKITAAGEVHAPIIYKFALGDLV